MREYFIFDNIWIIWVINFIFTLYVIKFNIDIISSQMFIGMDTTELEKKADLYITYNLKMYVALFIITLLSYIFKK